MKGKRKIRKNKRIIPAVLAVLTILAFVTAGVGCSSRENRLGSEENISAAESVTDAEESDTKSDTKEDANYTDKAEKDEPGTTGETQKTPQKTTQTTPQDSGITICIDPGHYTNSNVLYFEDGTSYCESDVTLSIAQKLHQILEEKYGIHSYLTRNSGSITIDGLTDKSLDRAHLHLRGEKAEGADLFISLHTNANLDYANGYPTCEQPISINKPILLANMVAAENETALKVGNAIGKNIASMYREQNLGSGRSFEENMNGSALKVWTDAYNDSTNTAGTICVRNDGQKDYYGVLRGASNVGVPGYIIEHGFHTVPEIREKIKDGDLITLWAEADAKGIAEGFGVITTEE